MDQMSEVATEVVLEGGPAGAVLGGVLPAGQDRLKIPYRGGYEHFERLEDQAHCPAVFRWVARTKVAE